MTPRIATAALAALLLFPAAGAAQVDLKLRLAPQAGLMTPADWFYYEVTQLGEGPMEWTEAAILETTVVGLTAELEVGETGIWIRGSVLRTVDTDTYIAFAILNAGPFTPPNVVRRLWWVPTDMTIVTLDVALPTRLRLPLNVQPYVTAGIGGKVYAFDTSVLEGAPSGIVAPEDGTSLVVNVGGGAVIPLTRSLRLDLQARDAVSDYWDDTQHDVSWTAGLSWRAL
jgi:hypothetical protein